MRAKTLALLLALCAAAVTAGCKPRTPPRPPAPAVPLTFTQTTPDATVNLSIAPAIATWPDLHKKLYADGVAELRRDIEAARNDRAHIAGEGFPNPTYEQGLTWELSASTPQLVSLKGNWESYTGGAHPNSGFHTLFWVVEPGAEIQRAELLAPPGPADAPVQQALCDAIRQARVAKGAAPDADPSIWPCPKWRDSDFVLVKSTTPGKFGGVTFLFDPYAIGSYAEGPYEVTVPAATLKAVLAPAYADQFAGAPLPPAPPRPAAPAKG